MNTKKDALPLQITATLLPLIYYFTFKEIEFFTFPWFPNQTEWLDVALYGKSRMVMLLGIWMAAGLLIRGIQKKLRKPGKEFILLVVFGGFQFLSACFSQYPYYSRWGMIEQYEPIGVLLSYLVICFYAYEYVLSKGEVKSVCYALFIGTALLCVLGLTQLLQCDFWETDLGRILMVPGQFAEYREKLRFNFSAQEWGRVYMTLYNPNYAGIFLVLIIPLIFLWGNKKLWILGGAAALCLIGTFSKTALLAGGMVLLLGAVLCSWKSIFWKKQSKYGIALMVLLLGIMIWKTAERAEKEKLIPLDEVEAGTDAVRIVYNDITVYLRHVERETGGIKHDIRYEDGTKVLLEWSEERGECDPLDEKLEGIHFKVYEKDDIAYVQFRCQDTIFRFTDSLGTGKFEYVTNYGKPDKLQSAQTAFEGWDSLFTGRGYIWGRALPLIGRFPIFGIGPDTFMLMFPQNDYVAKARLGTGFFREIISNEHSLYLHIAVETGLPSLSCFLSFMACYVIRSLRLYYKRNCKSRLEKVGVGIFLGVSGYLLCGLTWSSSVCVAPIFWMTLGMGIALNEKIKEKR